MRVNFHGQSFICKALVLISVGNSYSPWHDCPSPVYPSLQVQMWEPFVLLQFELTSQTWLPSLHSLTSENKNELPKRYLTETIKFLSFERKSFFFLYVGNFILLFAKFNVMIIPWHECPSPVYPTLQVQLWEPSVLVQFALTSQAWLLLRHSSISSSTNNMDIEYFIESLSVWYLRTRS